MLPLVSILIPAYNAEKWLAETLRSALNQTWPRKEIIVVDDGSTDNTLAIAKSFSSYNVKILNQENLGASAARNRALETARGDYVQFFDADDILAPDKIEKQIIQVGCRASDIVIACQWARFYTSPQEALFAPEPVWADMAPIDWLICSWEGGGMMHPAAWLVPRLLVEKAGRWDESLSLNDDGEYFTRVLLSSSRVEFCESARSYYRSGNKGSLSNSKSNAAWLSYFRSLELCSQFLLDREDSPRTRHACATAFQRFVYDAYLYAPDLVERAEAKVKGLGGSELKPCGSPLYHSTASVLGWKAAMRLQRLTRFLR